MLWLSPFFWTLFTYVGVWRWAVFEVLSSLNNPQNQTTLWISIKWEIGVIHEGGSGGGGVTERKSSNSVWGLVGATATAVFLQRNDCICNVKPICNALFLLHAPQPQSQSDEGSQISAVTDNNGMWTDGFCTVWKCSIKPPPDWNSQPEMRLALAETYRVKVKVCTLVISVCWHTLNERTERPLEEGPWWATTEGARNGFDWLPGQGHQKHWCRPLYFSSLSPFYLYKTRCRCCTSGSGFQVFLQLDLHQKAETLMMFEDFGSVRKSKLTVEGEDDGCSGAHHASSLT